MKGYIYTMAAGADPGHGWKMNDPIFGPVPTLGACVPNIRRAVEPGDYIFVVSGRVREERQFVVGGLKVKEKIDALAAHKRFPQNRLSLAETGQVQGNIIIDAKGKHHQLDDHANFRSRLENYIVGSDPTYFETPAQYDAAREGTVDALSEIFDKSGRRVFDIIGRYRKMSPGQVEELIAWMRTIKP